MNEILRELRRTFHKTNVNNGEQKKLKDTLNMSNVWKINNPFLFSLNAQNLICKLEKNSEIDRKKE